MDWQKLFSHKRLGAETVSEETPHPRTAFIRDYDRIVFSSSFRRLQDKTQVFPLANNDYVRTRLTHSLEVACVGRSLGVLAGEAILRRDATLSKLIAPQDVGSIVAAACLAHDIGNPPFGHSGEAAIQEWYSLSPDTARWRGDTTLTASERADCVRFEGNAQGFRILCQLQNSDQIGGLQLTCAVLAAFAKYPRESIVDNSQTEGISSKKFGFMQAERFLFGEVAEDVGLARKPGKCAAWYRHPLAFLVEAADDICYQIMDIEDGFRTAVLTFDELRHLHEPWLDQRKRETADKICDDQRRAEYFRATTIDALARDMARVFDEHLEEILAGTFDLELSSQIEKKDAFGRFKEVAQRRVYKARQVVEIETCGFEVISKLMSTFHNAVEDRAERGASASARSASVLRMMPSGDGDFRNMSSYERAIAVSDFVAGMTDSFALSMYQRLCGIRLS